MDLGDHRIHPDQMLLKLGVDIDLNLTNVIVE